MKVRLPISRLLSAGAGLIALLVALVPFVVAETANVAAAPAGNPNQPTLLSSYSFPSNPNYVDYTHLQYRPYGQFTNGFWWQDQRWSWLSVNTAGTKWDKADFIAPPNEGILRTINWFPFMQLDLNRSAIVTLVWRDLETPTWLANGGWTQGPTFTPDPFFGCARQGGCRTFSKTVNGSVQLGGPSQSGAEQEMYYILLQEANGTNTPLPSQLGSPAAQPNQPCPKWVHDQYSESWNGGPTYALWHPPIDPVYWCYFGHEHGSNTSLFSTDAGIARQFGYAGSKMGMLEAHEGFKQYIVLNGGHLWYFTQHFGSNSIAGACNAMHELNIVERDPGGPVNFIINLVGDYGQAKDNNTRARLSPSACPNQGLGYTGQGERLFVVDSPLRTFYEPWRLDLSSNVLGIQGTLTINTLDPQAICDTDSPCNFIGTGLSGTHRYGQANRDFGIYPTASGYFTVNPQGTAFVDPSTPGATYQYVRPGFTGVAWDYIDDNHFFDGTSADCFRRMYEFIDIRAGRGFPCNVEGSITKN